LLSGLESEDEWKISCDENDDNIAFSAKSDNSFEVSEDESRMIGNKHKKPKVDPPLVFKCKTF
jgi:hypothetical protein